MNITEFLKKYPEIKEDMHLLSDIDDLIDHEYQVGYERGKKDAQLHLRKTLAEICEKLKQ